MTIMFIPLLLLDCFCLWSSILYMGNCLGSLSMLLGGGGRGGWGGFRGLLEESVGEVGCCGVL